MPASRLHTTVAALTLGILVVATVVVAASAHAQGPSLGSMTFFPVAPCRIFDTRPGSGTQGANLGPVPPGLIVGFDVSGGGAAACGVPESARGAMLNFVAVAPEGPGHLTVWPWDSPLPPPPNASVLNFDAGRTVANGVALRLCHPDHATTPNCLGDLLFVAGVSATHLVVDVLGYYAPPGLAREWGRGRPGVSRTGVDTGQGRTELCANGDLEFGLSNVAVRWGEAPTACPATTWVCTAEERGSEACDTARTDDLCDTRDCAGECWDNLAHAHPGFVADYAGSPGGHESAVYRDELGFGVSLPTCFAAPVWCCSSR